MKLNLSAFASAMLLAIAVPAVALADNANMIVGVWQQTKSDIPVLEGATGTDEYTSDGKVITTVKFDWQVIKIEGTYKVNGDKVAMTTIINGEAVETIARIKKLTADELEIETQDEESKQKVTYYYIRVK